FAPLAEVINDHRPYIASSLGLSLLVAWILDQGAGRLAPHLRHAVFAAACVLLCFPAVAFDRYRTWQWGDSLRMWEDTVQKSPGNSRAWMNAGLVLLGRGNFAGARHHFARARSLAPDYAYPHMNLSVLDTREGRLEDALRAAQRAVRLRPDLAMTHFYLGQVLESMGRIGDVVAAYQTAIELSRQDAQAQSALARLERSGDLTEDVLMRVGLDALYTRHNAAAAAAQFRKVLDRNPRHYGATFQLAVALDHSGQPAEARPMWEKVLEMAEGARDKPTADRARARLAAPDGASEEATQQSMMSAGLDALYRRGDPTAAAAQFRKVLDRNAGHY